MLNATRQGLSHASIRNHARGVHFGTDSHALCPSLAQFPVWEGEGLRDKGGCPVLLSSAGLSKPQMHIPSCPWHPPCVQEVSAIPLPE
jgi:hypothetical protein